MKKLFFFQFLSFVILNFSSYSCPAFGEALKIGIMAGPSQEIMKLAQKEAKKKYSLDIQILTFSNYQIPNEALNIGDLDANIFQTLSFFEKSLKMRNYKLKIIGKTFIYPMGIYSKKIKNLRELKDGDSLAIPNDPSNYERALALLKNAGITDSKKKIKIVPMDASQIARASQDLRAVVLNNDFVLAASFHPSQALYLEDPKNSGPYVNIIVARNEYNEKKDLNIKLKQLESILHSKLIIDETSKIFPGAIPAW